MREKLRVWLAWLFDPLSVLRMFQRSALWEVGIFYTVLTLIDVSFGFNRYWGFGLHPYFLVVLLVSSQYGTVNGLLSALVASVLLLSGTWPEYSIISDAYAYAFELLYRPMAWIAFAFVVGGIVDRHIERRNQAIEKMALARQSEEEMGEECQRLQKRNEKLEIRIASQMRTGLTMSKAALAFETLNPKEVLLRVSDIVFGITGAEKFSLFLHEDHALHMVSSHNWTRDDLFTIHFSSESALYQELVVKRRVLSVISEQDRAVLKREGILALPLMERGAGEVLGVLKVESIGFLDLHIATIETFKNLADWIATSYLHAQRHEEAVESSLWNPSYQIFSQRFLEHQERFLISLAKRIGFSISMLVVHLVDVKKLTLEQRQQAVRILSESVRSALRKVDQAFEYDDDQYSFVLLLPGTPLTDVSIVIEKLSKHYNAALFAVGMKLELSYEMHALHEHVPASVA